MATDESIEKLPELTDHLLGPVEKTEGRFGDGSIEVRIRGEIDDATVVIPYELYASANFGVEAEMPLVQRIHELSTSQAVLQS